MSRARNLLACLALAGGLAPSSWSRPAPPVQASPAAAVDLALLRARIEESNAARKAGDFAGARALAAEVIESLLGTPESAQDTAWLALLDSAGTAAFYAQDARTAHRAFERVCETRSAALPEDHRDLLAAQAGLAASLAALGDLAGARDLKEHVLEVALRTRPDDHPDLQRARQSLAQTLYALGELERSRSLAEKVLQVRSRTLPGDDAELQAARGNLAVTLAALGDLAGARTLFEQVLEVSSRTLHPDHPNLQAARLNLASTIQQLGDLAGSRALFEQVLEVSSRTLSDDHPALQSARLNLAVTLGDLGDLAGARALHEKVLAIRSAGLNDDHPDLQSARLDLAAVLHSSGDLAQARALNEKVLEVYSQALPDDHPHLQAARAMLAVTIQELGDIGGARALEEKVLAVRLETLPDNHPDLQVTRKNLALTLALEAARREGDAVGTGKGEEHRARCVELLLDLLRAQTRTAREVLVSASAREAQERCASLAEPLDLTLSFARGYGVFEPSRELEAASFELSETTRGAALAAAGLARRAGPSPRYAELRQALVRASADLARLVQQESKTSADFDRACRKREAAEIELIALARELSGGTLAGVDLDLPSLSARLAADSVAVSLRRFTESRVAATETAGASRLTASTERLCAFVVRGGAPDAPAAEVLTLVDLGAIEPIEAAVQAWHETLGVAQGRGIAVVADAPAPDSHAAGVALRRLVFDPLLAVIGSPERIVFELDDVLHLVAFDALPLDEGDEQLLGDRWRIETRSTLTELMGSEPEPQGAALLALGGPSFDMEPDDGTLQEPAIDATAAAPQPMQVAAILRGSPWEQGFQPLPHTAEEARGIGALYAEAFGERPALVLEERRASCAVLAELAPRARFLHVATHGWHASESICSWSDPRPIDQHSGLGLRLSGAEQIRGMSPMLLSGLALAGANLQADAAGRATGLITAEELSALDLSGCELAVLSACDTSIGERRAGQGVASLQRALQMAGARTVVTSLWKVPDEATKELMLDFYRRVWIERQPKHQALWHAKRSLREARDERGHPEYTTRDWAAWVLTGDPR